MKLAPSPFLPAGYQELNRKKWREKERKGRGGERGRESKRERERGVKTAVRRFTTISAQRCNVGMIVVKKIHEEYVHDKSSETCPSIKYISP